MNLALRIFALAGFCLTSNLSVAEQAPYPKDESLKQQEIEGLNWLPGNIDCHIEASHSSIRLPETYFILLGKDAERYKFLANGVEFPETEITAIEIKSHAIISIEFYSEGFVSDTDWSDIDVDGLLQQQIEGQQRSNEDRIANGQESFEVLGWLEKPSYDPTTKIARYIIELGNEERTWLNAVAIKLGREGYHKFIWVGDMQLYKESGPTVLNTILNSHAYDPGYNHSDHKDGDKVAAYSLAGLMAAVIGIKLSKGILAGILTFLVVGGKKLAILIVPFAIGIFAVMKRLFRRS